MRGVLWLAWPTIFLVGVAAFMLRPGVSPRDTSAFQGSSRHVVVAALLIILSMREQAVIKAVPSPWSISAGGADKASVLPVYPKTMIQVCKLVTPLIPSSLRALTMALLRLWYIESPLVLYVFDLSRDFAPLIPLGHGLMYVLYPSDLSEALLGTVMCCF